MKYRKKPVVVEAVQWFEHGDHPAVCEYLTRDPDMRGQGWVGPLGAGYIVAPGDWIITGPAGDVYPCTDAIFRATYEEVAE